MARQPARVLEKSDVQRLFEHTKNHRQPARNAAIVMLSFKAGLRACEIAGLTWTMVLDTSGRVADHLTISGSIAKYGRGRLIPMHSDLRKSLQRWAPKKVGDQGDKKTCVLDGGVTMVRYGKKHAGRLSHGMTWDQSPVPRRT